MPSASSAGTVRLARMGMLMALAGGLQVFEAMLPTPAPWFRIGLANAVVLVCLQCFGPKEAAWVAVGKVLLGGLLTGRLLSPGFLLSMGGTGASTVVMIAAFRAAPPLGFVGVSVLGAEAHALAQLTLASTLFIRTPALWALTPLVGTLALAGGCLTGLVAHKIAQILEDGRGVDDANAKETLRV